MQGISILASIISISLIISVVLVTQYGIGMNGQYIAIVFLDKNLKPVDNVFYQLFAFYPSDKGTVFKEISEGFIEANPAIATISLSDLKDIAKAWYDKYHDVLHPSLIGFASYMENESGNIILRTQSFTVNYDPLKILNGIGMTQPVVFNQAQVFKLDKNINNQKYPQYYITTTTVPYFGVIKGYTYYQLNWVVYYPSQQSLGPIPLIEVNASSLGSYYQQYGLGEIGIFMLKTASATISLDVSAGYESNSGSISYSITGQSLTLSYGSSSNSSYVYFGNGVSNPLTEDIYIEAQLAFANYTIESCWHGLCNPEGYYLQTFATALEVTSSDPNNSLPVLYTSPTLFVPFNWTYATYWGEIKPGSGVNIYNLNVTNNVLPYITVSIPVFPFLEAVSPALAFAIGLVLRNLDLVIQSSNSYVVFSLLAWVTFNYSPVPFLIYYQSTPVNYLYNNNWYNVPQSIFYIEPAQGGGKLCLKYNCPISNNG